MRDSCETIIRPAIDSDLGYILSLSKAESKSLGFIPKMAYESAITGIKTGKRWSNKCNDKLFVAEENGDLVGFVLGSFGIPTALQSNRIAKVAQICLQEDARMIRRGRMLLDSFIEHGKSMGVCNFRCGCADDLESNMFWLSMGWVLEGSRMGISYKNTWIETSKRKVNIYTYRTMDLFMPESIIYRLNA